MRANVLRLPSPREQATLQELIADQERDFRAEGVVHMPAEPFAVAPPLHLDEDARPEFGSRCLPPSRPTYAAVVERGRVFGYGNIISPDNRIVDDATPGYVTEGYADKARLLESRDSLPQAEYVDGRVFVMATMYVDSFYHWLYHVMPKLALATGTFDRIYVSTREPFQRAYLDLAGVVQDSVIEATNDTHIEARELYFTSYLSFLPTPLIEYVRGLAQDCGSPSAGRRLYITRRSAPNGRPVQNEDELLPFLAREGFEIVDLAGRSVREQIALFSSAAFIAGPHGAGMGNIVYCAPGTKVMEMFAPCYVHPCMWLQTRTLGLHYAYVLGEGEPEKASPLAERMRRPVRIDVDKFKRLYWRMAS